MTKTLTITFEIKGDNAPQLVENEKKITEFLQNEQAKKKFLQNFNKLKMFL